MEDEDVEKEDSHEKERKWNGVGCEEWIKHVAQRSEWWTCP